MAKKKAAWTVMVYLAGDNNLTTECLFALAEMKKAASGKRIKVIAQFDPADPFLPTHRYEINKNGENTGLAEDIIDQASYDEQSGEVRFKNESRKANALAEQRKIGREFRNASLDKANLTGSPDLDELITDDTDTGSPITLYNFISFCLENYKAEHYMVVLSGHAGGTERDYLLKDESSARSLTFNELKQVFKRVRQDRNGAPIDIVGMDNCLMSMAEICYELRGLAEVVVGCESFSPASGWPYRQILERLRDDFVSPKLSKGKSTTLEAAKAIVEEYVNYYSDYWMAGMSVAQSAINLTKVEKLHLMVDELAKLMEKQLVEEYEKNRKNRKHPKVRQFKDSLVLAHWESQSYNGEQFVDLFDFCDCLQNRVGSGRVAKQCGEVKEFISSELVLKSCYYGATYQYSYGVSLYFPWAQVANGYWNLDFIGDSNGAGWGSFLRTYTLLTRRRPRNVDNKSKLGGALNAAIEARFATIRMINERMINERMINERMINERMINERMINERMINERMINERMINERMIKERMINERMGSSSRNRVHSMRNPPNMFFPDECVRDQSNALVTQETLRIG